MRYAELILERSYVLDDVRVWQNPGRQQLEALVDRFNELRGVVDDNDYWVWNAADSVHWDVRKNLGIHNNDFLQNFFVTLFNQPPEEDSGYNDTRRFDGDAMTLWINSHHVPPGLLQAFPSSVPGGQVSAY